MPRKPNKAAPSKKKHRRAPSSGALTLESYLSEISSAASSSRPREMQTALMRAVSGFQPTGTSSARVAEALLGHVWEMKKGTLHPLSGTVSAESLTRSMAGGGIYVIPKLTFAPDGSIASADYNDPVVLSARKVGNTFYFQACDAERAGIWNALDRPVTKDNKLVTQKGVIPAPTLLDYILDFFARFFFSRREVCALWDTYAAARSPMETTSFSKLANSLSEQAPSFPVPEKVKAPTPSKELTGSSSDRQSSEPSASNDLTDSEKKGKSTGQDPELSFAYDPADFEKDVKPTGQDPELSFVYDPTAFGEDVKPTRQDPELSFVYDPTAFGEDVKPEEVIQPLDPPPEDISQEPPVNPGIEQLISTVDLPRLQLTFNVTSYPPHQTHIEFPNNRKLVEAVGGSNDPKALLDYARTTPILSRHSREHLEHRAECLKTLQELEAAPPPKRVQGSCTQRDGGIFLSGVTQPRKQDTGNGCWSVSLSSQIAYRGVEVDQQVIRAFRPDPNAQDFIDPFTDVTSTNKDSTQSIGDYANLVHRILPNTAVYTMACTPSSNPDLTVEDRVAILKHAVRTALQEHNSPLSLVSNLHFITVYGMDEEYLYCKNPATDSEYAVPIEQVARARTGFQAYWLQDMEPTLSGGTTGLHSTMNQNAVGYSGGRMFNGNSPIPGDFQTRQACVMTDIPGCSRPVRMEALLPDQLRYRRQEGLAPGEFALNLDVLERDLNGLRALPHSDSPAMADLLKTGEQLLSGRLRADHSGLHQLAQRYCTALAESRQAMEQARPGDREALKERYALLRAQTDQMKQCMAELLHHKYMAMLGQPHASFSDPEDAPARAQMERGMAGMLLINSVNRPNTEDKLWLHMFSPANHEARMQEILEGRAFRFAMDEFQTLAKKEIGEGVDLDERKYVRLKRDLMSKRPELLLGIYQRGLDKGSETVSSSPPQSDRQLRQDPPAPIQTSGPEPTLGSPH